MGRKKTDRREKWATGVPIQKSKRKNKYRKKKNKNVQYFDNLNQ